MQPQIEIISQVYGMCIGIIIINQKLNMLTFDTVVFCDILLGGAGVSIFLGGRFGGSILRPLVSGSKQQVRCLVKETHQLHCTLMCPKKRAGFGPLAYSRPVSHPTSNQPFWVTQPKVVRVVVSSSVCLNFFSSGPRISSYFKRFWWFGTPTIVNSSEAWCSTYNNIV